MKPTNRLNRISILTLTFFGLMAALGLGAVADALTHGLTLAHAGLLLVAAAPPITNEAVLKTVRDLYQYHVTALHGLMDKLPDTLKGEIKQLHDALNEKLSKLPPIEQVAGAQQASWALECLSDTVSRLQTYAQGLVDRLSQLGSEYSGKLTEFNALKAQTTDGTFLTKEKAKELAEVARTEGVTTATNQLKPELRGMRTKAIELAGLPVPPDAILELPQAEFDTRIEGAQANVTKLGEKGLKLGGRGDSWVKNAAWLGATEFAGQLKTIDEILPAPAGGRIDPLLGNPGSGAESSGGAGADKPRITLA